MPHSQKEFYNKVLGRKGEKLTRRYLRLHGYRIVACNYVTPFGEADIIAKKRGTFCFIEVKAREGEGFALPSEAVDRAKRERYRLIARYFCAACGEEVPVRFDVAAILNGKLEYFADAFR